MHGPYFKIIFMFKLSYIYTQKLLWCLRGCFCETFFLPDPIRFMKNISFYVKSIIFINRNDILTNNNGNKNDYDDNNSGGTFPWLKCVIDVKNVGAFHLYLEIILVFITILEILMKFNFLMKKYFLFSLFFPLISVRCSLICAT